MVQAGFALHVTEIWQHAIHMRSGAQENSHMHPPPRQRGRLQSSLVRAIPYESRAARFPSREARSRVGGKKRAGVVPAVRSAATSASPVKASRSIKAARKKATESKEKRRIAERRQTLIRILRILADAARALQGALACRRSTAALTFGNHSIPKAQLQARLPGTRSARALPAFACPSPGMHLPPRS